MKEENFNELIKNFDKPQTFKNHVPSNYKGPLPFDRFGQFGHLFYTKDHSGKYGHYCDDWDGLYICEDCDEFKSCTCFKNVDLSDQDKVWAEEINPLLVKLAYVCAEANVPMNLEFEVIDTMTAKPFKIVIYMDENQNYNYTYTE